MGIFISINLFAGENLQIMRCIHTIDGVSYDEGGVSGPPLVAKSKCEARIDGVHASNPRNFSAPTSNSTYSFPHIPIGAPVANSNAIHCDVGVSGSIGNGPYN